MTPEIKDIQRASIEAWEHMRDAEPGTFDHLNEALWKMFPGPPEAPVSAELIAAVEQATGLPFRRHKLAYSEGYAQPTIGQLRSHCRRWGAMHYREQYGL